jgi:hypothetical protein
MARYMLTLLVLLFPVILHAQSKKERQQNKIKSVTEWETTKENGSDRTTKTNYEAYDRDGRITVKEEYSPEGVLTHKESVKYDSYGNKVQETIYDTDKDKSLIRTYKYNVQNDRTAEMEYTSTGILLKTTLLAYNAKGQKTSETITNGDGALIKKVVYSYNSRNLKAGKQTFTDSETPENIKKWEYEYY